MDLNWLDWPAVALLGGIVGASELISRYKDDPGAAIKSWPAIFYIAINAAASVAALGLILSAGWFAGRTACRPRSSLGFSKKASPRSPCPSK